MLYRTRTRAHATERPRSGIVCTALSLTPTMVCAQSSPFATGATALQSNLLTILAPVAIIAVMVLGVAAWFNRISWAWMVGGVGGIVLVFGSSQVVTWIRGLFGV